ncbi:hypothetical protein V6N11_019194 [Hibiscus sabdariffa]|uniref:Uncharacterized protein n=1 Tax=Hibiscus sabdariffa TaxID=183260 RepID=A0ABR2R1Z1_9ROSI
MLVEKKQHRQTKQGIPSDVPVDTSLAQGSRFNPIFMSDADFEDPADQTVATDTTTATVSIPTVEQFSLPPTDAPASTVATVKAKAKGKATLLLRKPPTTVLAPKNLNIMPQKSGALVGNSSRSRGRHVTSPLNPENHGAVVISNNSAPVSAVHGSIQQGALPAFKDSNLSSNVPRVLVDTGDVVSGMVE